MRRKGVEFGRKRSAESASEGFDEMPLEIQLT